MPRGTTASHGVTLIELMVVLAISTLLLGGAWRLVHSGLNIYQRGLRNIRVTQEARTVLATMTRDIQRALATAIPHGIRGAENLEMQVLTSPPRSTDTVTVPAARRIRYTLEPRLPSPTFLLKREVVVGDSGQVERTMPLSARVQTLTLRYFDGEVWHDTWQRAAAPRALELAIVFQEPGRQARPYHFTTMVTAH